MPQVPTFTDLPNVQGQRPEVVPQSGIDRFQRAELEKPGEGLQAVGQAVQGARPDASNTALHQAAPQNVQTAKTQALQHQQYVNNLGYVSADGQGGPAFYALKGQAAVDARPAFLAAIQAQRDQAAQGMPQAARNLYMAQTDADIARETGA